MGTQNFLEVEAKFAVSDTLPVPDFRQIAHVDEVDDTNVYHLSAIYYDTDDLALTRAKVTLRRRTGGKDSGWHLKLPSELGRVEVHADFDPDQSGPLTPPEEVLRPVKVLTRNRDLVPIAQVDNDRHETVLRSRTGTEMAEFCDDHVTAWSLLPGGSRQSWREWEVELGNDVSRSEVGQEVLTSATRLLIVHGASVSHSPSKLVMALGDSINNVQSSTPVAEIDEDSPLHAVVNALADGRDRIIEMDPQVRRDEWDSVHQMRVATRELRSHMQTFEGIIVGPRVKELEKELKHLAGLLGVARDAEVVEARLSDLVDQVPIEIIGRDTRAHLVSSMSETYRTAHDRIVEYLDSDRYFTLLRNLDEIIKDPPTPATVEPEKAADEEASAAPADNSLSEADEDHETGESESNDFDESTPEGVLAAHLAKAYDKLHRRHVKAVDEWEDDTLPLAHREANFHNMRKAAKKLRYSAEAVGKATDLKTKKLYDACKAMQTVLGDFQDSVTSREVIAEKAQEARDHGRDTFGYGVLYHLEMSLGLQALSKYREVEKDIRKAYRKLDKQVRKAERRREERLRREEIASAEAAPDTSTW